MTSAARSRTSRRLAKTGGLSGSHYHCVPAPWKSAGGYALEGVSDSHSEPVTPAGAIPLVYKDDRRPWQDLEKNISMNPLGDNLLPLLVLAIGGAMAAGNLLALIRPPEAPKGDDDLAAAPLTRSLVYIVLGIAASIWAIASIMS